MKDTPIDINDGPHRLVLDAAPITSEGPSSVALSADWDPYTLLVRVTQHSHGAWAPGVVKVNGLTELRRLRDFITYVIDRGVDEDLENR